jgi:VanZ family protein
VPRLTDAIWNTLGLVIGLGLALVPALRPRHHSLAGGVPVPLLLVGLWIAYRLAPFVPSLDVQNVKDSLKPLLLTPFPINWLSAAHGAAGWLSCGALWQGARAQVGTRFAATAMVVVFAAEVLVVDNVVTSADAIGAAAALGAWVALARCRARPASVAALVLGAYVLVAGLAPFELRPAPVAFEWLPFRGFLGGSMLANVSSLLEKLFNYGALIWLLGVAGGSVGRVPFAVSVAAVVGLTASLEAAQTVIVGRTPEITDPLLALLIGVAVRLWRGPLRRAGPLPSA